MVMPRLKPVILKVHEGRLYRGEIAVSIPNGIVTIHKKPSAIPDAGRSSLQRDALAGSYDFADHSDAGGSLVFYNLRRVRRIVL